MYGKEYKLGFKHGRPDVERIGLFAEMPRIEGRATKKPYEKLLPNALGSGPKTKCGNNDGYFNPFLRVFEKEAYPRANYKNKRYYVNGAGPWVTTGPTKWHATPGDIYGTFTKEMPAFSAQVRKEEKAKDRKYLLSFVTNPGKKGNCGYVNIGLSKYPEHLPDRYGLKQKVKEYGKRGDRAWIPTHFPQPAFDKNPFFEEKGGRTYVPPKGQFKDYRPPGYWVPPGKMKMNGGPKGGCINNFPEGMPDKYVSSYDATEKAGKDPVSKEGTKWLQHSRAMKTMYTASILNYNTDLKVNAKNYKTYKPNYTKLLV